MSEWSLAPSLPNNIRPVLYSSVNCNNATPSVNYIGQMEDHIEIHPQYHLFLCQHQQQQPLRILQGRGKLLHLEKKNEMIRSADMKKLDGTAILHVSSFIFARNTAILIFRPLVNCDLDYCMYTLTDQRQRAVSFSSLPAGFAGKGRLYSTYWGDITSHQTWHSFKLL